MQDWGLGEESPLSIGGVEFRDWVQDRYAELVAGVTNKEDVAFRPAEQALSAEAILECLADLMECDPAQFCTRARGQPYRPFAVHFLTRFGRLSRRQAAFYLGVRSGQAVTNQLGLYRQAIGASRQLRKLFERCEATLRDQAAVSIMSG